MRAKNQLDIVILPLIVFAGVFCLGIGPVVAATGDDCSDPYIVNQGDLPYTDLSQTTCGALDDYSMTCLSNHDSGEDVIYEINLTNRTLINIALDPKGTVYSGMALDDACPIGLTGCIAISQSYGTTEHFIQNQVLNAGTYYLIVDKWDISGGDCLPDYDLTINGVILGPGDSCGDPAIINQGDLPYYDLGQTTCGRGYNYSSTCLDQYDGGEDMVYELNLTSPSIVDITFDPKTTSHTGIAIDHTCPPDSSCIDFSTNSGTGVQTLTNLNLAAGTYYILVDKWDVITDCIPEFDLSVSVTGTPPTNTPDPTASATPGPTNTPVVTSTPGPTTGDDCLDPVIVNQGDLPYTDLSQTTCGRLDDYSSSCLGNYDTGEDMIYQLNLTQTTAVTITLDPKSNPYSGFALDDNCPPDSNCIAFSTSDSPSVHSITDQMLDPGTYYIMVDKWDINLQECLPEFDLTITGTPSQTGDTCDDPIIIDTTALPYQDLNQTTCGRFHVFENTCQNPGDDDAAQIFYQLDVPVGITVDITLDPKGFGWSAMTLDNSCPPDGDCIAADQELSGFPPWGFNQINLPPGTYYLFIGNNSINGQCIADFDLFIDEYIPPTSTPTTLPTTTPTPLVSFECPVESEFSQQPIMNMAYRSDDDEVDVAADSFSGLSEDITAVRWWGIEAINDGSWSGCSSDLTYTITFYADGSVPGSVIDQQIVTATRMDTTVLWPGIGSVYQYNANLNTAVALTQGWISVEGSAGDDCWLMWLESDEGDGSFQQDTGIGWETVVTDLAFCLVTGGGIPTPEPTATPTSGPAEMDCLPESEFAQPPIVDQAFNSDGDTGYLAAESFSGLSDPISEIRWWGIEAINSGGWTGCDSDLTYAINFHEAGAVPGALLEQRNVTAVRTDTGVEFLPSIGNIQQYNAVLTPSVDLASGWVSIVGATGDTCWFMWVNSNSGDNASMQDTGSGWDSLDTDLALCIITESGQVTPVPTSTPGPIPSTGPAGLSLLILVFSLLMGFGIVKSR